jgi:hypothetical protein
VHPRVAAGATAGAAPPAAGPLQSAGSRTLAALCRCAWPAPCGRLLNRSGRRRSRASAAGAAPWPHRRGRPAGLSGQAPDRCGGLISAPMLPRAPTIDPQQRATVKGRLPRLTPCSPTCACTWTSQYAVTVTNRSGTCEGHSWYQRDGLVGFKSRYPSSRREPPVNSIQAPCDRLTGCGMPRSLRYESLQDAAGGKRQGGRYLW